MNKKLLMGAMILGVALTLNLMRVDAVTKGEKGLVVGHAIEISTYAMKGFGEDFIGEMQNRAKQGFPVGIIEDETNELWVCVYRSNAPASGMHPGNAKMAEFMGLRVVVQGLKYRSNGVNVIRFGNISEY